MDATQSPRTRARSFALRGVVWSLGLFGLLRLDWFDARAVLPLTRVQARVAAIVFGAPALPIDVTLACSGADAVALCAGAILAYPASWRARFAGVAGGIAVILVLNVMRIGTLGRAAASSLWFGPLHVYVWPGLLVAAIAGYVFVWMRGTDVRKRDRDASTAPLRSVVTPAFFTPLTRRFLLLAAAFFVVFIASAPFYLQSAAVLAIAAFIAHAAAWILNGLGVQAGATANVLSTSRGAFMVTQECISTPLIPVYLAGVFACTNSWRPRAAAILALLPLFVGLGIARLLVVALPAALVASPIFLIHAFYQLLLAIVVVFAAAVWRHGPGARAWRRAVLGVVLGGVLVYVLDPRFARIVGRTLPFGDAQGALALLPAFQVGLYAALCVAALVALRWRPVLAGLTLLALSQITAFAALRFVAQHTGAIPHVRDVRAWTLTAPLLLVAVLVTYERPRR